MAKSITLNLLNSIISHLIIKYLLSIISVELTNMILLLILKSGLFLCSSCLHFSNALASSIISFFVGFGILRISYSPYPV